MFDFAWSEIGLIVFVALIAIGPKDLPVAIKTVSQMIKKARRMAGEFQTHVDEMVKEANLGDVRDSFNDLRRMDIKGQILKAVDGDGDIRKTFTEPLTEFSPPPPPVPVHDSLPVSPLPAVVEPAPELAPAISTEAIPTEAMLLGPAPDFVPPRFAPPQAARPAPAAPAFIPPAFVPAMASPIEHA